MKRRSSICQALVCLGVLLSLAPASHAQISLSGNWIGSIDVVTPDGKTQHDTAYLVLRQSGTDLSGGAGQSEHQLSEIKTGNVTGSSIEFTAANPDGAQFIFSLTLDGDHLKGTMTRPGRDFKASVDVSRITAQSLSSGSPDDKLYKEVSDMDSRLFTAFNHRDIDTMAAIFDKNLEFYHDKEGMTDYQHNIDNFRRHFAEETRVRREVVHGTMQVYPLAGYGAVELCIQRFYTTEKGKPEYLNATSRMVGVWHNVGGSWTLTRVISYDHR